MKNFPVLSKEHISQLEDWEILSVISYTTLLIERSIPTFIEEFNLALQTTGEKEAILDAWLYRLNKTLKDEYYNRHKN